MKYDRLFFEKKFSPERMNKYFALHQTNPDLAKEHYRCNLSLSESLYPCLSIFEITLRNALVEELIRLNNNHQWYQLFYENPMFHSIKQHIEDAKQKIASRNEMATPSKITAELTFGFWVSLMNSEYESLLWHDLRRAFPHLPKPLRKRKIISSPLNRFRRLRNRIYHNEPICWNLSKVEAIHDEILIVTSWMDKDLPSWIRDQERFEDVCQDIRRRMGWHK
ncbi:MAG: Abi family protein [Bacteroidales bacterium]|nr:Abi family protein [Bacteroidales bacterium]